MQSFMLASLLAGAAIALPAPQATASSQPVTVGPYPVKVEQVFSLVAKITKQRSQGTPLAIDNWSFGSAHIGAGEDAAVLFSTRGGNATNPFNLSPETLVQNGTSDQIRFETGYVERYPVAKQPNPLPFGVTILPSGQANDAGQHYVGMNAGPGSAGTGIAYPYTGISFHENQPILSFTNQTVHTYTSQFYACEEQLYTSTVPRLYWRSENGTTPAACVEVALFAQCAGNATAANAASYHTLQSTPCYEDAISVPYVGQKDRDLQ